MSSKIERLARAADPKAWRAHDYHIERMGRWEAEPMNDVAEQVVKNCRHDACQVVAPSINAVRAILRELRDPTPEMVDASWRLTGESKEMRSRTHIHYARHFTAMIDALLSEEQG